MFRQKSNNFIQDK